MPTRDTLQIESMAKYDKDMAQFWGIILAKINELRQQGETLEKIGRRMGVGKDTVSRWVREERGGERNSFSDIMRYIRGLEISPLDFFGEQLHANAQTTQFDKAVAQTIVSTAQVLGKSTKSIVTVSTQNPTTASEMLNGNSPFSLEFFYNACKHIGVEPNVILNRAAELTEQEQENENRHTA